MRPALASTAGGGVLLALVGACGNLATIDQVTDLRALAMRADPPDQVVAYAWDDAGGVFPAVASITVSALIADPAGQGRSLHADFATCALVDADTHQCSPSSIDFIDLGQSDAVPDGGPAAIVSVTFTPSPQLLIDALRLDAYHGFGYLPLAVQLTLSAGAVGDAGAQQVTGVKFVTFTAPLSEPPQSPNTNPVIPEVLLEAVDWTPGSQPLLALATDGGALVTPVPQPALWETYEVPTFSGGTQQFTEDWTYAFYCTAGQFSRPTAGGVLDFGGGGGGGGPPPGIGGNFGVGNGPPGATQAQSTSVLWTPAGSPQSQPVYYWIVVLDGRGGTDWVQRQAQYQIPSPP